MDKNKLLITDRDAAQRFMQQDKVIDMNNPVMTVYGVQSWIIYEDPKTKEKSETLEGTALYSSQGKAGFAKQQLEENEKQNQETLKKLNKQGPSRVFKQMNYPVY